MFHKRLLARISALPRARTKRNATFEIAGLLAFESAKKAWLNVGPAQEVGRPSETAENYAPVDYNLAGNNLVVSLNLLAVRSLQFYYLSKKRLKTDSMNKVAIDEYIPADFRPGLLAGNNIFSRWK